MPPLRFFVHRVIGECAASCGSCGHKLRSRRTKAFAPGGSSMNGMNLSGKPGMVQPMQMPPTLGHPPMPAIQPRLGDVAIHHRAPAAELARCISASRIPRRNRLARSSRRDRSLHAPSCRTARWAAAARRAGSSARARPPDTADTASVSMKLSGCTGTTGHVHDRQAGLRFPIPAQIIGQAHAAGRIAGHGVNAAVGGAGAERRPPPRLSAPGDRSTRWS